MINQSQITLPIKIFLSKNEFYNYIPTNNNKVKIYMLKRNNIFKFVLSNI
jgi:hypothetical protein